MDITIVLFIVSALLGVINALLGLGYKNMKDQIKMANEKADKAIGLNADLEVELANSKTNNVERFSEVNQTINKVEKSILKEIRTLGEAIAKLKPAQA